MSGNIFDNIYAYSPIWLQNVLLSTYGYIIDNERYGRDFDQSLEFLLKSQYFSLSELKEYQRERLKLLVKHSYENIPYYYEIFTNNKLTPKDIQDLDDLPKIPVLKRADITRNFEKLIAADTDRKKLKLGHTSGTTGSPLEFFWDHGVVVMTNAVHWRQRNWAGLHLGDKFAVLLGRTIVPIKQNSPPFWRYNFPHKQLFMSSFHLKKENMVFYVEKMKEFRPVVLEGYPSTVFILAQFLISSGQTFPLTAVLTSSETLRPYQREIIEKAFECKVFDYYGMAERTIFATECAEHTGLHLNMEYGITEIIGQNGAPQTDGAMGRVVTTGLHNFAMPLIRYETSDISALGNGPCRCGRCLPLLENITTKAEDIITTKDGRYVSSSVLTHPFKPLHSVIESQIIQEDIENIVIRIVKNNKFSDDDRNHLEQEFHKRVGYDMKIHFEFCDEIPRTSRGKFRWVISKVPLDI
jgi:phenylacetate-CoA ligase